MSAEPSLHDWVYERRQARQELREKWADNLVADWLEGNTQSLWEHTGDWSGEDQFELFSAMLDASKEDAAVRKILDKHAERWMRRS